MYRLLAIVLFVSAVSPAAPDRALVGTFSAPSASPHMPVVLVLHASATIPDPERYTIALAVPPDVQVRAVETPPATVCIPFPAGTLSCYGGIDADETDILTVTLELDRCAPGMVLSLPAAFHIRDTFTPLTTTFTLPVAPPCPVYLPVIGRHTSAR